MSHQQIHSKSRRNDRQLRGIFRGRPSVRHICSRFLAPRPETFSRKPIVAIAVVSLSLLCDHQLAVFVIKDSCILEKMLDEAHVTVIVQQAIVQNFKFYCFTA